MLYLPDPVVDYIYKLTVEHYSPAYLLVNKDGRLSDWGGKVSLYGLTNLQQGEYVEQQVLFLAGLLPVSGLPIFLPCVKMESGISADVHIFSTQEGDWVLLLDASLYENQHSLAQQKVNDLSLIRQQQAKGLNQHLQQHVQTLPPEFIHLLERGERREVTILLVKICAFDSYIEANAAPVVLTTLNSYVSSIMQPLLDEGGMVDKIKGDAVMSLFGVLPVIGSPPALALKAALRIIEAVREIGTVRRTDSYLAFDSGIVITSGSVVLGVIGSQSQKTFIAAGEVVHLAEKLGYQLRPNEILIDENTFNQLEHSQQYFSITSTLNAEPVRIYSYLIK